MDDVPFDLRSLRVITYDVEHPSWGQLLKNQIEQGLKETLQAPERSVLPTFLVERPDTAPKVSAEEKRLLVLQQQIDSLRSEIRATAVRSPRRDRISAPEARERVEQYVKSGMPRHLIVKRLVDMGAPRTWVEEQITSLTGEDEPED
jgi:hypothetical protein